MHPAPVTRDFGDRILRPQLVERRERLEHAIAQHGESTQLVDLLEQVDAALARMNDGSYGLCKVCHDAIERPRLLSNPLADY
jgi:RNA polymerase-binding transcription factor DksA